MTPRRFRRDARGSAAVEFGFVALPFIMLMMGIIEMGYLYVGSTMLDNAVYTVSRKIRTGETQSSGTAAQIEASRVAFRDAICAQMDFLESDCKANLTVDVRTVSQFQDITLTSPISGGVFNPGALDFKTGGAGDIVLVRAYYRWKLIAPTINQSLVRLPGESLLTAITAFKNEPYDDA